MINLLKNKLRNRINSESLRLEDTLTRYENFSLAAKNCHGYSSEEIATIVASKSAHQRREQQSSEKYIDGSNTGDMRAVATVAYCYQGSPLRVLEFGGACGSMYDFVSRFCPRMIDTWNIVETEVMVHAARMSLAPNCIGFFTSIDEALKDGDYDLVWAQGVLQFIEFPYHVLDQLIAASRGHLYIARLPLRHDADENLVTKVST